MTRVSDLAGAELDYWVARVHGAVPVVEFGRACLQIPGSCVLMDAKRTPGYISMPHYSTYWEVGGPLIEKHHIETAPTYAEDGVQVTGWVAFMFNNTGSPHPVIYEQGPTPLIAAMRALVASVYGEEVKS